MRVWLVRCVIFFFFLFYKKMLKLFLFSLLCVIIVYVIIIICWCVLQSETMPPKYIATIQPHVRKTLQIQAAT